MTHERPRCQPLPGGFRCTRGALGLETAVAAALKPLKELGEDYLSYLGRRR